MSLIRFAILVLFSFTFNWHSAFAEPLVTRHEINGYEVFVVDVQTGNQFGFTWAVPYGTADDPPQFWGRAHFFEHMVGRGSLKFPGHDTLINKMRELGFQRNAATGLGLTYYFAYGHEQNGLEALEYSLAPLGGVQLEPTSFANEKKTVINEIIDSAPSRPDRALVSMTMRHGLPEGHPLQGHQLGTYGTLEPMTPEHLQALHASIYRPGIARVAVFGNFTSGSLSRQHVVEHLAKALPANARTAPKSAPTQPFPPLFQSRKATKVLEIDTPSEMDGAIIFELPPQADPHEVKTFMEVFTLPYQGGVQQYLKINRGWITGLDSWVTRVGQRHIAMIAMTFTESGFENRDRVVHEIMQALELYKKTPANPALFEGLKQGALHLLKKQSRSVESLVQNFANWMTEKGNEGLLMFDWQEELSRYTPETVMNGARALDPQMRMVSFSGPLRQTPESIDEVYKLPFRLRGLHTFLPTMVSGHLSPANIHVPRLDLKSEPLDGRKGIKAWDRQGGWTEILTHDEKWPDRMVTLDFELDEMSPLEQLSLETLAHAFAETHVAELHQLNSLGVLLNVSVGSGRLMFEVSGEGSLHLSALAWAMSAFRQLQPEMDQIKRFKEQKIKAIEGREIGFPASVAASITQAFFAPRLIMSKDLEKSLPDLNREKISALQFKLERSQKILMFAGAFRDSEIQEARVLAQDFSPGMLGPVRVMIGSRRSIGDQRLAYSEPWISPSSSGVAATRVFRSPSPANIRDRIALRVVQSLLHQTVFIQNRPQGYVQGVGSLAATTHDHHLMFYGQANDAEKLQQVMNVWDEAIQKWLKNEVTSAEIEKAKAGVKAALEQVDASAPDSIGTSWSNYQTFGHPFYSEKMRELVDSVDEARIRRVAAEYLHQDRGHLTIYKGTPVPANCEALLLPDREAVREKLKVDRK